MTHPVPTRRSSCLRYVTAGRECAAGTGDDDHVGMPIGMREQEDVRELLVHVVVAGVEQFGTIEGDRQAPALAGQQQRAVLRDGYGIGWGHGSLRRGARSEASRFGKEGVGT